MSDDGDDDRAAEVVGLCRERMERGERVDVEAVAHEHPDLAPRLRRLLGGLRRVERAFAPSPADAAARPDRTGRRVGPYRLVRELGAGGMGTVWLATAESAAPRLPPEGPAGAAAGAAAPVSGASVAVKLLHPHLAARTGFVERFLREAEIGTRIRHENVVRTLGAGEDAAEGESLRFVAMEYVEGRTLRALSADLGRVPEELCRHIGREVAKALAAVHAAGAVHRDLKPENVLITPDHVVKVMDLGVARLLDDAAPLSQTGAFVGSLRYGAPEQFLHRDAAGAKTSVDARADLHALGLLLYELATGTHPFDADEPGAVVRRVLDERPRRAGELNPQLSPFLEELLVHLLEKDRNLRPASAQDVARILEDGEESAWWHERSKAIRETTHRPLRRIRIPRETALYGREAELAALRAVFVRAKAGDGQVLLVEGEAGIGKSRLIDEFVGALAQVGEDVNFLFGSYPPAGAATASGAFATAYREHLGDDEAALRAALPQTPLLVPAFAALLRGDVAPDDAEKLTKDSLQTVFVHATRSFAAERPTIVLIDDLHFAPEEGRALFASLALAVPGHRVLIVGCARPSLDERWVAQLVARTQTTRLAVPRLGPKELVRLLGDALRSERLAEELGGLIALKSDGNPFFVFELLRGLRDGQFLRQRPDGTWETTQVIRDIQVPSSIAELVQARVADLDPEEKDLLDVAACCGFEFDPLVVAAALGRDRVAALQALGRVEKRHRLVRSCGRRFAFDHHQVQEALYAGLSEPLREEYHAMLGDAVEARHGAATKEPKDVDGAVCVELAEHFLKGSACAGYGAERTGAVPGARTGAGLAGGESGSATGQRALRYLDAALTHLEANYLSEAAIDLADSALAAPALLRGAHRSEVLLRKASRLDLLGRRDAERAAIDEALGLADAAGDPARRAVALNALGWYLAQASRHDEARLLLVDALDLARSAGERRVEAAATGNLGNIACSLGRFAEAQTHLERRLALAKELEDRGSEAAATGTLGVVFGSLGRFPEAQAQHERHLVLARETGDRSGEARATGNLGAVCYSLGHFADAQAHCERHLALAREIGDRPSETIARVNLGSILRDLGRFAESRAHYERGLVLAREIGDRQGEAIALLNLGPVHLALGDQGLSRRCLEASLALCRQIGARYPEGYALCDLAATADEEGDAAGALALVEQSLVLRRQIGQNSGVVDSLIRIGDLCRRNGDAVRARTALEEALALARAQGQAAQIAAALAHLACLPGGETSWIEAAREQAGESGGSAEVRFLLWQATLDPAQLVEAKRLLDELVAHAPPECRESMVANVRLHREITAAARERGVV